MEQISDPSIHIMSSTYTEGVALPYNVSMLLNDADNQKDISIRISKYINEASIHFRNEIDVAEFLLVAGE